MPSNIDQQIQAKVQEFVNELSQLVKAAALDAVGSALGDGARARGVGRFVRRAAPGIRSAARVAAPTVGRAGKRAKRTSEDVDKLADDVLAYVKANDGQRLEEIGAGMKISTKELKLPVAKLLEGKRLKTTGQKRGTRYFAGGARGGAAPKAKATVQKRGRRRAGRSPEQKAAMRERMAKARAARAAKLAAE